MTDDNGCIRLASKVQEMRAFLCNAQLKICTAGSAEYRSVGQLRHQGGFDHTSNASSADFADGMDNSASDRQRVHVTASGARYFLRRVFLFILHNPGCLSIDRIKVSTS
jgi:hypothetical protein